MNDCLKMIALILFIYAVYLYLQKQKVIEEGQRRRPRRRSWGSARQNRFWAHYRARQSDFEKKRREQEAQNARMRALGIYR